MELKMNPTESVEQKINDDCNEDEDDALSLRDLQMYDQTSTHSSPRSTCFSAQELFEFFPTHPTSATTIEDNNIMFFGKLINQPHSSGDYNDDRYQNDLRGGSSSFRLPERRPTEHVIPTFRSVSNRGLGSPRHGVKSSSSVKKVNFAALTSKSKRRLFLFGPMPEMEMSSIRERQGRRAPPSRMFPVVAAEGGGGGGVRKAVTGTDKNTTVRCRSRLNSVFERSVSCLRM